MKTVIHEEGFKILDKPVKPLLAFDLHTLRIQCEKNFIEMIIEKLKKAL